MTPPPDGSIPPASPPPATPPTAPPAWAPPVAFRAPPATARPEVWSDAAWWAARRWWLLATLVVLAGALLAAEELAIEAAFFLGVLPGDLVLWVGAPLMSAILGTIVYQAVTGRSIWGQRRWRWSDLAWGAGAGVVVMVIDTALIAVFDLVVTDAGPPVQGWIDSAMLATPLLVGIGVSIATPFGEEVVCRGLLLRGFEARLPRWVAVATSSVIFGLLHLEGFTPTAGLHVVSATLAGVVFALVLLWTGHLLAAVAAHLVVNGTYTVLGILAGGSLLWTVGPGGDIPRIDLDVGDCARAVWWEGEPIDRDSQVDCAEAHDVEIISREHLEGRVYDVPPGEGWLMDLADDSCFGAFEAYVGSVWEDSAFDYIAVLPEDDLWRDGDRELICLLVPYDEDELIGSARGSGR